MQDPDYIMPLVENMACSYFRKLPLKESSSASSAYSSGTTQCLPGWKALCGEDWGWAWTSLARQAVQKGTSLSREKNPRCFGFHSHRNKYISCQRAGCGATHLELQHLEDRAGELQATLSYMSCSEPTSDVWEPFQKQNGTRPAFQSEVVLVPFPWV